MLLSTSVHVMGHQVRSRLLSLISWFLPISECKQNSLVWEMILTPHASKLGKETYHNQRKL